MPTEYLATAGAEPGAAAKALDRCIAAGGVAVFPADGLYGLACDPLNSGAIKRIHEIKGRDDGKPSAVMYFAPLALRELIAGFSEPVRMAAARLLPGPVTLVVPNPEHRYPLACREDRERLGLRLIEGPLSGAVHPIFQTSANRSGEPAPSRYDQVPLEIRDAVDLGIDGGALTGMPSTVIDLVGYSGEGGWRVLREGALPEAEVRRTLDRPGSV